MMRRNPTALLVSGDASLVEAVHEAIGSIGDLDLVVAPGAAEAHHDMSRHRVALLLVHQDSVGDAEEITRLTEALAGTNRSLPMLVLSNRHRAEQALALLRLG